MAEPTGHAGPLELAVFAPRDLLGTRAHYRPAPQRRLRKQPTRGGLRTVAVSRRSLKLTLPPGSGKAGAFRYAAAWKHVNLRDLLLWLLYEGWDRLAFTMQHQLQTEWCWAAVSTSVSHYFDSSSTWTQCGVVNAELRQTTCCANGGSNACNQPWYLQNALTRTGNLASTSGAAAFSSIDSEIDSGRPVCARIGWSGGGGHFVAIVGYDEALLATMNYVAIADPWYGSSDVAWETFRTSYQGSGTWTDTFYTKA